VFGCPLERQFMAPDAQLKERNLIKIKSKKSALLLYLPLWMKLRKHEEENYGHVVFKSNIGGLAGK
jgi:hypothetical protein